MSELVELHPAFIWDCPECGREQFERGIVAEFSEEDRDAMMEEQGLNPGLDGDWMLAPDQVTCNACGAVFKTKHMGEEEDL